MMLPRTRETPTQGEASREGVPVAHKQNEFEQQVGLVSFATDLGGLQMLCLLAAQRSTRFTPRPHPLNTRHAPPSHTLPKSILNLNFKTWGPIFKGRQ